MAMCVRSESLLYLQQVFVLIYLKYVRYRRVTAVLVNNIFVKILS